MIEFILSFVVFVLVITFMCIGLFFKRPAIKGSCGGLSAITGLTSDCGGRCGQKCKRKKHNNLSN